MSTLGGLDWAVIGIYFAVLFGLAWWVILQNRDTADDYFLAGRNLSWWIIGGSIFASNIGSEHLVGLSRVRGDRWRGHGALRVARVVPARAGVAAGAVLHAVESVHDAGVSGTAIQRDQPVGVVAHYLGRLRRHKNRGGHLRRGRRVQGSAARNAHWEPGQFLGWFDPGGGAHRRLHRSGRVASRRLHGSPADRRPGPRFVARHRVWLG